MAQMNGTVIVESTLGNGSRFAISVPLEGQDKTTEIHRI
jgi:chemotaxis protein histidine kinase CheA